MHHENVQDILIRHGHCQDNYIIGNQLPYFLSNYSSNKINEEELFYHQIQLKILMEY